MSDSKGSQDSLSQCEDEVFEWCWSDTHHGREVTVHSDKHKLTFHPNGSNHSSAIRGTKILRKNMENYFEVELSSPFYGHVRQVGIGTEHTPLENNTYDFSPLIGKDTSSWGVNYDGRKFHRSTSDKYISIDPEKYDTIRIGVLYDSYYGTLSYKFNGKWSGVAFDRVVTNLNLYPMVCSSSRDSVFKLTHCCSAVMSLKGLCRGVVRQNIQNDKDYEKLSIPSHIKSYLIHKSPKSRSTHRVERRGAQSPSIESTI